MKKLVEQEKDMNYLHKHYDDPRLTESENRLVREIMESIDFTRRNGESIEDIREREEKKERKQKIKKILFIVMLILLYIISILLTFIITKKIYS